MRCSLSRLPCRRHNRRSRAVMPNWHSRLTYAAPTTALCALVTRDQQCNLAKAASGFAPPTVLNTVGRRVFQGKPRGSARVPAPTDTWRPRTSPRRGIGSSLLRGPDSIWGPGPGGGPELPGRFGAPAVLAEGYLPRDMWRHRTLPKQGAGPGPFAESRAPDHRGPAFRPLGRS